MPMCNSLLIFGKIKFTSIYSKECADMLNISIAECLCRKESSGCKVSRFSRKGMFDEERDCIFCGFNPLIASLNGHGCIRCGEPFDKYENDSIMCETCDYSCTN